MHFACSDLESHHNTNGIKNSCPQCGWFAKRISDWPRWNGKVSSAAIVTRTINLDFAELSADHPSAGLEEGQADAAAAAAAVAAAAGEAAQIQKAGQRSQALTQPEAY